MAIIKIIELVLSNRSFKNLSKNQPRWSQWFVLKVAVIFGTFFIRDDFLPFCQLCCTYLRAIVHTFQVLISVSIEDQSIKLSKMAGPNLSSDP